MPAKRRSPRVDPGGEWKNFESKRQRILDRYWELANLDPEVTKGTITGQLKALDSLFEELGLRPAGGEHVSSNSSKKSQDIYRAAWMRPLHPASSAVDVRGEVRVKKASGE